MGYDRPGRVVKLDQRKKTAKVAIGHVTWDVSIDELMPQRRIRALAAASRTGSVPLPSDGPPRASCVIVESLRSTPFNGLMPLEDLPLRERRRVARSCRLGDGGALTGPRGVSRLDLQFAATAVYDFGKVMARLFGP